MSDQRIAELYELLVAGKFKLERPRFEYPYQSGWNAGIDFALKQMRVVCDEIEQPSDQGARETAG